MNRLLPLLLIVTIATPVWGQTPGQTPEPYTAAVVVEPTTGQVLYDKNAQDAYPPASMTKMMTLLLTLERIHTGELKWDTRVTVSALASKMGGSQVYLRQGDVRTVRELSAATMVHSANDAAMALAEHIGGTSEAFAELMNERAKEMGLTKTTFFNPHGLPAKENPELENMMSPMDLAKLGVELMKYPEMRRLAIMQQMAFESGTFKMMYNPNRLLKIYPSATGIKTGYHGKAGFCVTGSARKNDMDLIVVVMGSVRKEDNFRSAANLLTQAFGKYRMAEVVKKGAPADKPVVVTGGQVSTVQVTAGAPIKVLLARGEDKDIQLEVTGSAAAPIQKGQQVGMISVKKAGKEIGKVPAIAAADVAKEAWYKRWLP